MDYKEQAIKLTRKLIYLDKTKLKAIIGNKKYNINVSKIGYNKMVGNINKIPFEFIMKNGNFCLNIETKDRTIKDFLNYFCSLCIKNYLNLK